MANEAFLTSGECYPATQLLFPFYLFWNGASIFISYLRRNLAKAIACLPLGAHTVRNYFQFTTAQTRRSKAFFGNDWRGQVKAHRLLEGHNVTAVTLLMFDLSHACVENGE